MKVENLATVIIKNEKWTLDRITDQNGASEYAAYYWDTNIDDGEPITSIYLDPEEADPIKNLLQYHVKP